MHLYLNDFIIQILPTILIILIFASTFFFFGLWFNKQKEKARERERDQEIERLRKELDENLAFQKSKIPPELLPIAEGFFRFFPAVNYELGDLFGYAQGKGQLREVLNLLHQDYIDHWWWKSPDNRGFLITTVDRERLTKLYGLVGLSIPRSLWKLK